MLETPAPALPLTLRGQWSPRRWGVLHGVEPGGRRHHSLHWRETWWFHSCELMYTFSQLLTGSRRSQSMALLPSKPASDFRSLPEPKARPRWPMRLQEMGWCPVSNLLVHLVQLCALPHCLVKNPSFLLPPRLSSRVLLPRPLSPDTYLTWSLTSPDLGSCAILSEGTSLTIFCNTDYPLLCWASCPNALLNFSLYPPKIHSISECACLWR